MKRSPPAPDLPMVPLFDELLTMRGVSREQAFVYGVIAAMHAKGHHPTLKQIAYVAKVGGVRHARRLIAKLERVHMVRRVERVERVVHYELMGPTLGSGERAA